MNAGSVIKRPPRAEATKIAISPWSPLKAAEPLLQYMQTTATQTLEIQDQILEELKAIRAALERALWITDHPDEKSSEK